MLSSTDVSQMFASQQGALAQQVAFSQQIGVNAPVSGGFMRPPPSFPGIVPPPPVFSYAPNGLGRGYEGGNRFAGSVMSGLGGAASLTGTGLGIASMFGRMGAIAPLLDPIAGGIAGYGGMGVAGALAGAALPIGLAAGAGMGVHSFVHGGQQFSMMNRTLSQNFQFLNPASRSGQGFDRTSMEGISSMIHQLSQVPDLMTNFDELTRLVPKLRQIGTMQGVRGASDFSKRFKEQIQTLREMSKVLGTTMEEAADFFAHSKSVGFNSTQKQMQNAMAVQFTASQTGMQNGQVMQMQQMGANMATSMGVRREVGATAITNMAQMLQRGVDRGAIKQSLLEDITGQQGAAAIGAGAGVFTNLVSQLGQSSSMGEMSMLALADFDKNGKFSGINKARARAFQRGDLSTSEMRHIVGSLSTQQKISATARMPEIAMQYAGETGPGGLGSFALQLAGGNREKALRELELNSGGAINAATGDAMLDMAGQSGIGSQEQELFSAMKKREAAIKQRTDPKILLEKFKTKVKAQTLGRLEETGGEFLDKVGRVYDNFVDDLVGRAVVSMTDESVKKLKGVFSNGGKTELQDLLQQAGQRSFKGGSVFRSSSSDMLKGVLSGAASGGKGGYLGLAAGILHGAATSGGIGSFLGDLTGFSNNPGDKIRREASKMGLDVDMMSGRLLMSDADIGKQISIKKADWAAYGKQSGNDELRNELGRMGMGRAGETDWASMSEEDRARALEKDINSRLYTIKDITGKTSYYADKKFYEQTKAIRERAREHHQNEAEAIRLAYQGGFVDESQVGNMSDAMAHANVTQRADLMKKSEEKLISAVGPMIAQAIKAKPSLYKAMQQIQKGNPDVMGVLTKGSLSPEEKAKILKEKGYGDITGADINVLFAAAGKMVDAKKNNREDPMKAINQYVSDAAWSDIGSLKDSVKTMAGSVTESKLNKALEDFGNADTKEKLTQSQSAIRDAIKEATTKYAATGDKKYLESLGGFAGGVEEAAEAGSKIHVGQTISASALAKKFHLSEDDLQKEGIQGVGGKITIATGMKEKLMAAEAANSGTRKILGIAQGQDVGGDQKTLIDTLKHIDTTLDHIDTHLGAQPPTAAQTGGSASVGGRGGALPPNSQVNSAPAGTG